MIKKIAGLVGAGALLLTMAGPAFASFPNLFFNQNEVSITNHAIVTNVATTKAYSGDVTIGGWGVTGSSSLTGAASAGASIRSDVNSTALTCSTCMDKVVVNNSAFVLNKTYTKAVSGDISVGGLWVKGGTAQTGAVSASSVINNFVNTTVVGSVVGD